MREKVRFSESSVEKFSELISCKTESYYTSARQESLKSDKVNNFKNRKTAQSDSLVYLQKSEEAGMIIQ